MINPSTTHDIYKGFSIPTWKYECHNYVLYTKDKYHKGMKSRTLKGQISLLGCIACHIMIFGIDNGHEMKTSDLVPKLGFFELMTLNKVSNHYTKPIYGALDFD